MQLNLSTDPRDSSTCLLTYEEAHGWLRATWSGYVDPVEAMRGAEAYLLHAAQNRCPFLLNDNSQLRGPWFDSLDWLADVWVPQAVNLGLRAVAHVVQADQLSDTVTNRFPTTLPFELQIFHNLADAQHWLSQQQGVIPN
jgi:hypothetical protein